MAVPANLESLRVGAMLLGKYQIRGLIGRGGQATVYHSYDTFIDRDVAIKIMADAFDAKPEHARRAQMEARVLCKLQHPNIVQVFDAGMMEHGAIYIIMELLKGRTLREVIRDRGKLTLFEALSIGAQVADGVEIAHREHVIHRDLKPENIFVVNGNIAKVLDFGIAKFLALTGMTTQHDTLQGTMWYISPEHVQGLGVTARSDIYALGSILYEIICGTAPCLVGLQEISTQAIAWSQISRMPPQLNELMPEVPAHVGRLIQRLLVKDPNERPGSMAEVADALRTACQRLPADPAGSTMAIRELWRETTELVPPKRTGTVVISDSPVAHPAPHLMQATVEVRQSAPPPTSGSSTNIQRASAPVESGIITPKAKPQADQLTVQGAPLSAAAIAASTSGAPLGDASRHKATLFSRPVLITAVILGAGLGLALGFSNHLSSKPTEARNPVPSAASANVLAPPPTLQPAAPAVANPAPPTTPSAASSVTPNTSAATSATPQPAVLRPTPTARDTAHRVASGRAAHSSTDAPAAAPPKPTNAGPKPRYGVDDLE